MKKRTRNQHYVPRLHLRRFVGEQPKNMVWTYDNTKGTVRPSKITETGAQSNFYSIRADDGSWVDDLDNALQQVENAAAAPYDMLLASEFPTGQRRADFSHFVGTLYSRSPSLVNASARGYAQFTQHLLNLETQDRERFEKFMDKFEKDTGNSAGDRDELFQFVNDPDRFWIEISQKRGLRVVAIADELAEIFYHREWYLVDAAEDFFISSDSPVFKWLSPEHNHPLYGDGGFRNQKAEITLPLSPKRMLLITGANMPGRQLNLPRTQVWALNRARAISAERFLYAHVRDERVLKLSLDHKDTPEKFTIEGAGPFPEIRVTR